jgi:hypothetical protein
MLSRFILAIYLLTVGLTGSRAVAQNTASGSSSSKSKNSTEQHVKSNAAAPAAPDEGLYRNSEFGFTYDVRYGWVDRTAAMQPEENDPSKSRLLLGVFEHPPEVAGEGVNSAVIIAVESAASYPGLKTAADYMGPLTELTTAKGFKATQDPYEFPVGSQTLVRGDFMKERGQLTMYQSSLVMLRKGSIVSFSFIGGSEDEIEELIEKLVFSPSPKRR